MNKVQTSRGIRNKWWVLLIFFIPLIWLSIDAGKIYLANNSLLKRGMDAYKAGDTDLAYQLLSEVGRKKTIIDISRNIKNSALSELNQWMDQDYAQGLSLLESGDYQNAWLVFEKLNMRASQNNSKDLADKVNLRKQEISNQIIDNVFLAYHAADCNGALGNIHWLEQKSNNQVPESTKTAFTAMRIDCGNFENDVQQADEFDNEAAIITISQFIQSAGDSPLIVVAKDKLYDRLEQYGFQLVSTQEICDALKPIAEQLRENEREDFFGNCAMVYASTFRIMDAIQLIDVMANKYPNHPQIGNVSQYIAELFNYIPITTCNDLDNSTILETQYSNDYILGCAIAYKMAGQTQKAIDMLQPHAFNTESPIHQSAMDNLVDLMFSQSTNTGILPSPETRGKAPEGRTVYSLRNCSQYGLRFYFNGPSKLITEVPSCPDCGTFTIAPDVCPSQGTEMSIDLLPGEYKVLAETIDQEDVTPYSGDFYLFGGNEYFTCYYILIKIY